MSIKIKSGANVSEVLNDIEAQWNEYVPYDPNFRFLDDQINDLYINETLQARLFSLFSSISIIIACLGIFGLASYTAQQRKKEIGIRKSLGASVASISRLLASDYIKLVIIANVIAWPLSYYFADLWLQEFATRTSVGISVLVTALFAGLAIATLSVLFQSLRAAAANPVETLKED